MDKFEALQDAINQTHELIRKAQPHSLVKVEFESHFASLLRLQRKRLEGEKDV